MDKAILCVISGAGQCFAFDILRNILFLDTALHIYNRYQYCTVWSKTLVSKSCPQISCVTV